MKTTRTIAVICTTCAITCLIMAFLAQREVARLRALQPQIEGMKVIRL